MNDVIADGPRPIVHSPAALTCLKLYQTNDWLFKVTLMCLLFGVYLFDT